MAIDTEDKRRSVQAYTMGLVRPLADGAVSAGDRATVTWLYSGLSYTPPTPGGGGISIGEGISPDEGISVPGGLTPTEGLSYQEAFA